MSVKRNIFQWCVLLSSSCFLSTGKAEIQDIVELKRSRVHRTPQHIKIYNDVHTSNQQKNQEHLSLIIASYKAAHQPVQLLLEMAPQKLMEITHFAWDALFESCLYFTQAAPYAHHSLHHYVASKLSTCRLHLIRGHLDNHLLSLLAQHGHNFTSLTRVDLRAYITALSDLIIIATLMPFFRETSFYNLLVTELTKVTLTVKDFFTTTRTCLEDLYSTTLKSLSYLQHRSNQKEFRKLLNNLKRTLELLQEASKSFQASPGDSLFKTIIARSNTAFLTAHDSEDYLQRVLGGPLLTFMNTISSHDALLLFLDVTLIFHILNPFAPHELHLVVGKSHGDNVKKILMREGYSL